MAKHIASRKRIRGCRHSGRDLVIRREIRIFQCRRNAGSAKEKTAATAVIGAGNVTENQKLQSERIIDMRELFVIDLKDYDLELNI